MIRTSDQIETKHAVEAPESLPLRWIRREVIDARTCDVCRARDGMEVSEIPPEPTDCECGENGEPAPRGVWVAA